MQKMQECCHLFFLVVDHGDEVDWGVKNVFRLSDSPFKPPDAPSEVEKFDCVVVDDHCCGRHYSVQVPDQLEISTPKVAE